METIGDIVRELREHSGEIFPPWIIYNEDGGMDTSLLADRIEKATRRLLDVLEIAEIESNAIYQMTAHPDIERKAKRIYDACFQLK